MKRPLSRLNLSFSNRPVIRSVIGVSVVVLVVANIKDESKFILTETGLPSLSVPFASNLIPSFCIAFPAETKANMTRAMMPTTMAIMSRMTPQPVKKVKNNVIKIKMLQLRQLTAQKRFSTSPSFTRLWPVRLYVFVHILTMFFKFKTLLITAKNWYCAVPTLKVT